MDFQKVNQTSCGWPRRSVTEILSNKEHPFKRCSPMKSTPSIFPRSHIPLPSIIDIPPCLIPPPSPPKQEAIGTSHYNVTMAIGIRAHGIYLQSTSGGNESHSFQEIKDRQWSQKRQTILGKFLFVFTLSLATMGDRHLVKSDLWWPQANPDGMVTHGATLSGLSGRDDGNSLWAESVFSSFSLFLQI